MGGRREAAEYVGGDHVDELFLDRIGEAARAGVDEVDELDESLPFGFFLAGKFEGVGEGEDEGADLELFEEEGWAVGDGDFAEEGEGFEGGAGGVGEGRGRDGDGGAGTVVDCDGGGGEERAGGGEEGGGIGGVGFGDFSAPAFHDFVEHGGGSLVNRSPEFYDASKKKKKKKSILREGGREGKGDEGLERRR